MNYSLVGCHLQLVRLPQTQNDVMWCRIIQVPWLLPTPGYCKNWPCPDWNQDRLALPPSRSHGSRRQRHLERSLADAQQLKQPAWNSSATTGLQLGSPCAAPNHAGLPAETRSPASHQAWPCPAPTVPVPARGSPSSLYPGAFSAARFWILSWIA